MGERKIGSVKDGGDMGMAQMLYDEGFCELGPSPSNSEAIAPIMAKAMMEARNGTLDLESIDGVLAEVEPHVAADDPMLLSECRTELKRLVKEYKKKQAKQAKREAAAAPSSQSRPTVTGGDGCCRREDEPSNVA